MKESSRERKVVPISRHSAHRKRPSPCFRGPELLQLYAFGPHYLRPARSGQRRRPLVCFHCGQRDLYHSAASKTHWRKQAQGARLYRVFRSVPWELVEAPVGVMEQATLSVLEDRRIGSTQHPNPRTKGRGGRACNVSRSRFHVARCTTAVGFGLTDDWRWRWPRNKTLLLDMYPSPRPTSITGQSSGANVAPCKAGHEGHDR